MKFNRHNIAQAYYSYGNHHSNSPNDKENSCIKRALKTKLPINQSLTYDQMTEECQILYDNLIDHSGYFERRDQ